jgi:hypothetical protein
MIPGKDIIKALQNLDLSKYPQEEVLNELRKIGKSGFVKHTLHPNYELIRVRPNRDKERFSTVKELTYKPQQYNKTYQRGSTPNKTIFYGSSSQKDIPNASPAIGRITSILEAIPKLREPDAEFEQKVTFSKWVVIEDINLALICFDQNLHQNYSDHKYVYNQFIKFLENYPDLKERIVEINSFLAQEFSNSEPCADKDYLYMISSIYTEMVSEFHFEGVTYPSVRTIGYGINIAINPDSADKKLICAGVGEALIVKKRNKKIEIRDGRNIILNKGQTTFKF